MKHSGQNIFDCKYCEQMFPSKIKRIEHMAEVGNFTFVVIIAWWSAQQSRDKRVASSLLCTPIFFFF